MEKKVSKELEWLTRRKDFISIRKIEIELNLPEGTLKKFVDGKRGLADQWQKSVKDWVKDFKK